MTFTSIMERTAPFLLLIAVTLYGLRLTGTAVVVGSIAFMGMIIVMCEKDYEYAQERARKYVALTPEQKIEHHKERARNAQYYADANYHNQMAQTLIQDEIRKGKRR